METDLVQAIAITPVWDGNKVIPAGEVFEMSMEAVLSLEAIGACKLIDA